MGARIVKFTNVMRGNMKPMYQNVAQREIKAMNVIRITHLRKVVRRKATYQFTKQAL